MRPAGGQIGDLSTEKVPASSSKNVSFVCHTSDELIGDMVPSFLDVAEMQMKRGSANLSKPDLISIIIALDPAQSSRMYQLNALKLGDLNFIIRSIIYDTRRYETAPSVPPYEQSTTLYATSVEILPVEIFPSLCDADSASAPPMDLNSIDEKCLDVK